VTDARLITRAHPPVQKSKPKTFVILAVSIVGGMIFGFGLGFLREIADRMIRTAEQVQSRLKSDCIAVVPLLRSESPDRTDASRRWLEFGSSASASGKHVAFSVVDSPFSQFAEATRSIKSALDIAANTKPQVIGFTSSIPNEGKSTIAAALALLCAQVGARTILVDCDLRNPSLSSMFMLKSRAGILDVLTGTQTLNEAIWKEPRT